jgi:hypothetical protein
LEDESAPGFSDVNGEIASNMNGLAELFDKDLALRFMNRPGVSRHDALISVKDLKQFIATNRLTLNDQPSMREVLLQVARDGEQYEVGTAHHRWNQVISRLKGTPIEGVIAQAEESTLPILQTRASQLRNNGNNPFSSWRSLKECAEILGVFEQRWTLQEIASAAIGEKTRSFANLLATRSSVDTFALLQLVSSPEQFFSRGGSHVQDALPQTLGPLGLTHRGGIIDRFTMTAAEARDALTEGVLDAIREFPTHEKVFRIDANGENVETDSRLKIEALRGIGKRKMGIPGKAQSPNKLFAELQGFGKQFGINILQWLERDDYYTFSEEQCQELSKIIFGESGLPFPESHLVRVRIGRKDDPDVLAAVNDAAGCMPFGDAKNTAYTWNPNCSYLVVERQSADGKWRTMAQSVVMKSYETNIPTARIKARFRDDDFISTADIKVQAALPVLACDNIEPAPSEAASNLKVIEGAYRHFLPDYLRLYGDQIGTDTTKAIIGKEDFNTGRPAWRFDSTNNSYLPAAPIPYSDNCGKKSYVIHTGEKRENLARDGVLPVSVSDCLPLAVLEAKIYKENEGLVIGPAAIYNTIVAQQIQAEVHGDPRLSFVLREKNAVLGYILAGLDRSRTDEGEVYITDLAVDQSKGLATARYANRILNTFLEAFISHYPETVLPVIVAELRTKTSYHLVKQQINTFAANRGLTAHMQETGLDHVGGEALHSVRISFSRN